MSLSKRHYEAVAGILNHRYHEWETLIGHNDTAVHERAIARCAQARQIAQDIASYFANDNPKFNRERFMADVLDTEGIEA